MLNRFFAEYGVELLNFNVISINVPEDDESIQELKKAKSIMARLNITGKDTYRMTRTFDVLETAAANESNGGNLLNAGIGLGAGVTVGQQLLTNASTALDEVPPAIHQQIYYLAIGGATERTIYISGSSKPFKPGTNYHRNTLLEKRYEAMASCQIFL